MDSQDWLNFGMLIDDQAEHWYVLTHPGSQIPTDAQGTIRLPGAAVNFNTNILILGAVILAAVLLLRK
jgi:hypothetical protein